MDYIRYKAIPNGLKKYREAMELTQQDVAKRMEFKDKTRISHWENGDGLFAKRGGLVFG